MADPAGERFGAASDFSNPSPPTPTQKFLNIHLLVGAPPPPPPPPPMRSPAKHRKMKTEKLPLLEHKHAMQDRLRTAMFDDVPDLSLDPILDSRSEGSFDDAEKLSPINDKSQTVGKAPIADNEDWNQSLELKVTRSKTPRHRNSTPRKKTKLRPRSLSRNRKSRMQSQPSKEASDHSQTSSKKSSSSRSNSSRRSGSSARRRRSKSRTRLDETKSKSFDKSQSGFFRKLFSKRKGGKSDDGTSIATERISVREREDKSHSSHKSKPSEASSLTQSRTEHKSGYQQSPRVDEDQPTLFFATDEVSTLTNPTIHSQKKSEEDPMGSYWKAHNTPSPTIDPFKEPFFSEPEGASPPKRSSPAKSSISRRTFKDPSPRGEIQTRDTAQDPAPTPRSENRENAERGSRRDSPSSLKRIQGDASPGIASLTNTCKKLPVESAMGRMATPEASSERSSASHIIQNKADEKLSTHASSGGTTPKATNLSSAGRISFKHGINQMETIRSFDASKESSSRRVSISKPLGLRSTSSASTSKLLSSYTTGKFKNRRPTSISDDEGSFSRSIDSFTGEERSPAQDMLMKISGYSKAFVVSNRRIKGKVDRLTPDSSFDQGGRDVRLTSYVVCKGFELFRYQREYDITAGLAEKVVPKKKKTQTRPRQLPQVQHVVHLGGRRILAKAAIPIQSQIRRYLAQKHAVDRMWALIEIQSYCRRWRAEAGLLATIVCTVTIQAIIRGYLVRCQFHQNYFAAVQIQKVVRGHLSAVSTFDAVYRVVLVQAQFRGWLTRRQLRKISDEVRTQLEHKSVTLLQTWWRSRSARLLYQFLLVDAIIAQALIRRYLATQQVERLRQERNFKAAVAIQTFWRAHTTYSWFTQTLAALLIQKIWRGHRIYWRVKSVHTAVKIQAAWRRYAAFSYYIAYCSARHIQTSWRRYDAFSKYKTQKAAWKIQTIFRGYFALSRHKRYVAAKAIQTQWRCYAAYWDYQAHFSAKKIQAAFRGYVDFWDYKAFYSARLIQKSWRGLIAFRNTKEHLSARKIQTVWRMYKAATQFEQHRSAKSIQSIWRMYYATHQYVMLKAAIKIQATWRGFQGYTDFIFCLVDLLLLQRNVRKWLAIRKTTTLRFQRSSTHIQSLWRGYKIRNEIERNEAAIKIQKEWRCYSSFTNYIVVLADIISVQCAFRCWLARLELLSLRKNRAAEEIQRNWRGRRVHSAYKQHRSAVSIQKMWRRYRVFWAFQQHLSSARIQSRWRGRQQRKAYKEYIAARAIQKYWRGYNGYMYLLFSIANAIILQRWFRMVRAMKQKDTLRSTRSATKIQSVWRGFHTKCVVFEAILESIQIEQAAVLIQQYWRRYAAFTNYRCKAERRVRDIAVITIQRHWRGHFSKSVVQNAIKTLILLQAVVRSHQARQVAHIRRGETIENLESSGSRTIQRAWKRFLWSSKHTKAVASIRIQTLFRMSVAAKQRQRHRASILIQSYWRMQSILFHYKEFRGARTIQTSWRMHSNQGSLRKYLASRKIQASWRRHQAQVLANTKMAEALSKTCFETEGDRNGKQARSARKVHSFEQMRIRRALYRDYMAARKIQTFWRMYIVHMMYNEFKCARKIQSQWRARLQRNKFKTLRLAMVKIQSVARGKRAGNEYRLHIDRCVLIQAYSRRFLASRSLGNLRVPEQLILVEAESLRERVAIEKIQFWWRVVLDCRREKTAALTIERFFLKIKADIDAEVLRQTRKNSTPVEQRRKVDPDEMFLDSVWEQALESVKSDSSSDIFNFSDSSSPRNETKQAASNKRRSVLPKSPASQASPNQRPIIDTRETFGRPTVISARSPASSAHSSRSGDSLSRSIRQSSPTMRLIMRHEQDVSSARASRNGPKRNATQLISTSSRSSSAALERAKAIARSHSLSSSELADDMSLEEAFLEAASPSVEKNEHPIEQYFRKFKNLSKQPPAPVERFFADDLESLEDSTIVQVNEAFTSPRPATIPEEGMPPPSHVGEVTPSARESLVSPLSKKFGIRAPLSSRSGSHSTKQWQESRTTPRRSKSTPRTKKTKLRYPSSMEEEPVIYRKKPPEAKIYGTEYGII